jgi:hypothetical protein
MDSTRRWGDYNTANPVNSGKNVFGGVSYRALANLGDCSTIYDATVVRPWLLVFGRTRDVASCQRWNTA